MIHRPVHPYWGILEIGLFIAGSYLIIWVFGPYIGSEPALEVLFLLLSILGTILVLWISPVFLHHIKPADWGIDFFGSQDNNPGALKNAWPPYAAFTLFGATVLILYTVFFKPEAMETINFKAIAVKLAGYFLYGAIQAAIFFGFFLTRIRAIVAMFTRPDQALLHRILVVFLTSVIFSAFHTPNFPLMACTFFTGLFWAWIFYQRPNLLLLGLSHAILGTILHRVVQMHMRVGPFYDNPDLYILREIVPGLRQLIGNLF